MWLVLCDASDVSAVWAFRELCGRGVAPLELVTAEALSLADYWEHRIEGDRASVRFRPANGTDIRDDQLRGVLNRLYTAPVAHWRSAPKADQDYVQQELVALFLSWLHALPCPVVNRPTPQGLCGQWRPESEWVWLAQKAGLPVAPYRQSAHDFIDEMRGEKRLVPPGAPVQTVIVIGDSAAGAPAPPPVIAACRRLADLAATELLGIDFVNGAAGPWTFAGANPMPDLVRGGDALVDALCRRIAAEAVAA